MSAVLGPGRAESRETQRARGAPAVKKRIDLLLVERGQANSRQKAQALIMAGEVLVNDVPVTKAGQLIAEDVEIRIRSSSQIWVSRAAQKLQHAIDQFKVDVQGCDCLDIGASTGGFSQVLLHYGAQKVFAVDVGKNQLDWQIRNDPRVLALDGINARYLEFSHLGQKVDTIVVDVSFISLTKVIPALLPFAHPQTQWLTLIKPQFEVGRDKVGKGGIVRSEADRNAAVQEVVKACENIGLRHLGLIESPLLGTHGNKEFLAHWQLA